MAYKICQIRKNREFKMRQESPFETFLSFNRLKIVFLVTTSPKKVSLWRWSAEFAMFKEDKSSELRADGAASSTFFAFENAFYLIIVTVYNFSVASEAF